jgi:DeoR/GlpR family transcriptional regulator of sugar metabolism
VSVEPREEVVSVEGPSSRELYYCRKNIYEMLLKAGDKGVTLHEIMESISYSPETIRKSLNRLEREGLIKKVGREIRHNSNNKVKTTNSKTTRKDTHNSC